MKSSLQPNILFVEADQMTSAVLPAFNLAGQAISPNISKLAKEGILFSNAYCNSPLCSPSRACMFTGTRTTTNEVWGNGSELRAELPTMMHYLKHSGYRTVVSGKTHFIGPDQLHGFDKRLTTDIYPSNFNWSIDWDPHVEHRPGTSVKKLDVSGKCKTNNQILYDAEVQFRAVEFLRYEALEPKDTPFFLHVSYTQPHESYQTIAKYWDLYEDTDINLPLQETDPDEEVHPINKWLKIHHGTDQYPVSKEKIKASRRAYYAMITNIDEYIGELVDELKQLDLYENTIIIFTSDHGDMMGERGMWFKRTYLEQSVKVPLFFHFPRSYSSKRVDEIVSLADLCPTISEIGAHGRELNWFGNDQSHSFKKLLEGDMRGWKNEAIMEYFGPGVEEPWLSIRRNEWKYVFARNCEPILYNIKVDPEETKNLVYRPDCASIVKELHSKLFENLDLDSRIRKAKKSKKTRYFLHQVMKGSEGYHWDYQPVFNAEKQYVRDVNNPSYC